jgi:ATP-dependent DNA ligase
MSSLGLLVKENTSGNIYLWIEILYTDQGYYSSHGYGNYTVDQEFIKNPKVTTTEETISTPKNIGKKNQTSQSEQAFKDATAIHAKKIKEGYHLPNHVGLDSFKPMLCYTYDKDIYQNDYEVFMQPKIDGIRCITKISNGRVYCISRNNNVFADELSNYIKDIVGPIISSKLEVYLDGEIISNTGHLEDAKPITNGILVNGQYILFDMAITGYDDALYKDRYSKLTSIIQRCKDHYKNVELGDPSKLVIKIISSRLDKFDKVEEYLNSVINNGFEGLIVRDPNSVYEHNKRSKGLLKYKRVITEEYTILDILEGRGNRRGLASSIKCLHEGQEFFAGVKLNNEICSNIWINRDNYIGKMATVEYLDKTKYNIPKFAKFISIRDYE